MLLGDARDQGALERLLDGLLKLGRECEWVEFKHNWSDPEGIGEYISALSNSAAIAGMPQGFLVWGIEDGSLEVVGTVFDHLTAKIGNENLENWLSRLISPRLNLRFIKFQVGGKNILLLEIDRAFRHPTRFKSEEFVRVGSYTKKLKEHPEKEALLWQQFADVPFEDLVAVEDLTDEQVVELLDIEAYFSLNRVPMSDSVARNLEPLEVDELIKKETSGRWSITNLGALLYARNLESFRTLARKVIRIVRYEGTDRISILKQWTIAKGYATGFEPAVEAVMEQLPSREIIEGARRQTVTMVPTVAVRELLANAVIHQDLAVAGAGVLVEVFQGRIEISNPGEPVIGDIRRLLDFPPRSRNEALASHMRRVGFCEELGSGIDRVVALVEASQLPAPEFTVPDGSTRATLFGTRLLKDMDADTRVRACYWHACLKRIRREYVTNASLRERFGIPERNSATVSRLIKEAVESGLIKPHAENASNRLKRYVPFWVD